MEPIYFEIGENCCNFRQMVSFVSQKEYHLPILIRRRQFFLSKHLNVKIPKMVLKWGWINHSSSELEKKSDMKRGENDWLCESTIMILGSRMRKVVLDFFFLQCKQNHPIFKRFSFSLFSQNKPNWRNGYFLGCWLMDWDEIFWIS